MSGGYNMSAAQVAAAVAAQAGIPVLFWGDPGVGKTSWVKGLAEALGWPIETVIASIREPSDFGGLPVVHQGQVFLACPAWAGRLADVKRGFAFFDEANTAPPSVQAAMLRVVLERVVGDLEVPEEISMIAAANPTDTASGGWELTPALANRWLHLPWPLDADKWCRGIVAGFPMDDYPVVPTDWKKGLPAKLALVSSFIHHRKTLLLRVPGTEEGEDDEERSVDSSSAGRAWPSPRTWEMTAKALAAADAAGVDQAAKTELVCGCVGQGAGLEFVSWADKLDLPDPDEILARPTDWSIPERGDKLHAVMASVVAAVQSNATKDRFLAAWRAAGYAAQDQKEIAAVAVKGLADILRARTKNGGMVHTKLRGVIVDSELAGPFVDVCREAGILKD
jgi:MoxR-like ATPase